MKLTNGNFKKMLEEHLKVTRDTAIDFMKIGKHETSCIIKHGLVVIDGQARLKSEVKLLPVRRMYKEGDKLVSDEYLTYELQEEVEL